MITLDEAIKHCKEVAEQKDLESGFETDNERYAMTDKERTACKECAEEHRQLAEWLKELKQLREQEPILDKIRAEIDRARFIDKDTRHCRNALASGLEVALQIIDKYRAESEVQNEV